MPYKFETEKTPMPREKDRRIKLTDQQRDEIAANPDGLSQRALARKYGVSRRTVTFILEPEKLRENIKRRQERGGSTQYYDCEKQRAAILLHRRYKALVLKHPETILCSRCFHAWYGQEQCPICKGMDPSAKVWVSATPLTQL